MSIIGTGIAAGVANAGNTAKQQTATKSGKDAQRADSAQQTDKFTLSQLRDAGAARDTDDEMPDQQALGYESLYQDQGGDEEHAPDNPNDQIHHADAPTSSPTELPLKPSYGPSDHPLFHAINVKA